MRRIRDVLRLRASGLSKRMQRRPNWRVNYGYDYDHYRTGRSVRRICMGDYGLFAGLADARLQAAHVRRLAASAHAHSYAEIADLSRNYPAAGLGVRSQPA
jgi:hypothetical protein